MFDSQGCLIETGTRVDEGFSSPHPTIPIQAKSTLTADASNPIVFHETANWVGDLHGAWPQLSLNKAVVYRAPRDPAVIKKEALQDGRTNKQTHTHIQSVHTQLYH